MRWLAGSPPVEATRSGDLDTPATMGTLDTTTWDVFKDVYDGNVYLHNMYIYIYIYTLYIDVYIYIYVCI